MCIRDSSLDNQLNIIQVADLVLPDKDTTFEEYTTIELLLSLIHICNIKYMSYITYHYCC